MRCSYEMQHVCPSMVPQKHFSMSWISPPFPPPLSFTYNKYLCSTNTRLSHILHSLPIEREQHAHTPKRATMPHTNRALSPPSSCGGVQHMRVAAHHARAAHSAAILCCLAGQLARTRTAGPGSCRSFMRWVPRHSCTCSACCSLSHTHTHTSLNQHHSSQKLGPCRPSCLIQYRSDTCRGKTAHTHTKTHSEHHPQTSRPSSSSREEA